MKLLRKIIFLLCFAFIACLSSYAQDSLLIHYLINRIAEQQVKADNFFLKGSFPSYISNRSVFKKQKKDNNIFYNALILYTLKRVGSLLPVADHFIYDSIRFNALPLFIKFKNKKGRNTYNFWRTDSATTFPYTHWIHLIKKNTALPDDMDDTVLSLQAQNTPDSVTVTVHQLMQNYLNNDENRVKGTYKPYRTLPAYSTWFGKKFPVVFDVCVLSNVLSFVQSNNLEWTKADSASLQLIIKTIENKDHLTKAAYVSPYYGRTAIILYHLARLMSIKKIPALEEIKVNLITDAVIEFSHTNNVLEKIILCTAILKWGYIPPALKLPEKEEIDMKIEQNDMPFFIGNIPSYFPKLLKQESIKRGLGLFYHYCPGYNDALFLEYLLLKNEAVMQ